MKEWEKVVKICLEKAETVCLDNVSQEKITS